MSAELVFQNSSHFQQHWHHFCRYHGHSSLSVSQSSVFFRQGVLLPATCLLRLKSLKSFVGLIQMQCSPSFDCNRGKQNDQCLSYPPDSVGGVTEPPNCVDGGRDAPPSKPHQWGDVHPPLKFPSYSIFRAKGSHKTINFFYHFHGLIPDTNYKHLELFITLGRYSQLHRGLMSPIGYISALRVNQVCKILRDLFSAQSTRFIMCII